MKTYVNWSEVAEKQRRREKEKKSTLRRDIVQWAIILLLTIASVLIWSEFVDHCKAGTTIYSQQNY